VLGRALGAPLDAVLLRWTTREPGFAGAVGWRVDARDAWRSLCRTPLQSAAILVCLGIGSALTVVVFAIVNAMLGGDMPGIRQQRQLVRLGVERATDHRVAYLSMGAFRALPGELPGLQSTAAELSWRFSTSIDGRAVPADGLFVAGRYFSTLGTTAAIGRLIGPADDRLDAPPVVVLGYAFWQRQFDGRPDVIGTTIHVGTGVYRVIGVTPDRFVGLEIGSLGETTDDRAAIWLPMAQMWVYPDYLAARVNNAVGPRLVARLAPGLSAEQAEARAQALVPWFRQLGALYSDASVIRLEPYRLIPTTQAAKIALLVSLLMSVPLVVLGIACANVAGVQLARAVGRTHELAIRVSLGATRRRLVRLLLIETCLVSLAAGALAWGAAVVALRFAGDVLPFAVAADTRVLVFAIGLPLGVTVLAGFLPAWRATGINVQSGLQLGPRVGRIASPRFRRTVVISQIALSVALLVTTGLLVRSLQLLPTTIGQPTTDVLTASVRFSDLGFSAAQEQYVRRTIVDRLASRPDVTAVALSGSSLLEGGDGACWSAADKVTVSGWDIRLAKTVTPNFFNLLPIAVRQGRAFGPGEQEGIAVVNEAFLAELPDPRAAVGSQIRIQRHGAPSTVAQIIGVVEASYERFPRGEPRPLCYLPMETSAAGGFTLFARSRNASALVPDVEHVLASIDPRLAAPEIGTIADIIARRYRWLMWLTTAIAGYSLTAVLLAAVGLFGVVAYGASLRTHEFGVRLALGARPADLAGTVLRESLGITWAGVAIGVILAVPVGPFVRSLALPNIQWLDPMAALEVVALLTLVSLVAALMPLRRVTTLDPVAALRNE
jgi:predicted permease